MAIINKPPEPSLFHEKQILILPTLLGKKRLSIFETQITKEGGTCCCVSHVKSGQSNPTHIVVEDSLLLDESNLENVLKKCVGKVKVVVVGTKWLSDSIKLQRCLPTSSYEPQKHHTKVNIGSSENGSDPSPEKKIKLNMEEAEVEIYPQAGSSKMNSLELDKFACSQSSATLSNVVVEENQLIIQELQKLADAFRNKGDTWRSHGYMKAISAIKRCGKVLSSYEDALALPGVGDKMASKVWEILETGSLRKVSEVCDDEKTKSLEIFNNIWGVGPSTAERWFQQGCRSLDDIRDKISLSKQQEIGLQHYEDFLLRIPRNEVKEVGKIVSKAAKIIEPQLSITLVGSYRRGKESCGDIDVMIIKPDSLNSRDILSELLASLKDSGLVTADLVSLEKSRNQCKYLGVCRLPGDNMKYRRLDIFVVPNSEAAPALMHYTGSALFNRSMRRLAAKKGMSLSEHNLHAGIVREGLKVLNEGYVIPTPTEESIFEALDLPYRPPKERDH